MGFNLLITNRDGDEFTFFSPFPPPPLLLHWPSSDHIWSCRRIARSSQREISMSEYLKFLTVLFCISPSLHLRCTNAGCRATSWLIRASVTSSSSRAVEINMLRLWSWMLSYWWHELQMEGEMERWKWGGSKMDVCSLKFGDSFEDLEQFGSQLFLKCQ